MWLVDEDSKLRFSFPIQEVLHLKSFRKVSPIIFSISSYCCTLYIFCCKLCLFPWLIGLVDVQSVDVQSVLTPQRKCSFLFRVNCVLLFDQLLWGPRGKNCSWMLPEPGSFVLMSVAQGPLSSWVPCFSSSILSSLHFPQMPLNIFNTGHKNDLIKMDSHVYMFTGGLPTCWEIFLHSL